MSDEVIGIKESKEALHGILVLGAFIAKRAKDGLGADDAAALASALMGDEAFQGALKDAVDGIQSVPAELKDLSAEEAVELVVGAAGDVLAIIQALKSE